MANRPRPDLLEFRRKEGEARNEAWRKLTPRQQVESLLERRGLSKKQLKKIESKQAKADGPSTPKAS